MRLYLIRHAAVVVRPDLPGPLWRLSAEGRAAAEALANEPFWAGLRVVCTSPEPKALATAQRIAARHGLPIRIEADLREVEHRVWVAAGYRQQALRYLAGAAVDPWEPREAAQRRVRTCIDQLVTEDERSDIGIVSHGLVLTLYLADLLGLDADAAQELWSATRFPDVAVVDPAEGVLEQTFGGT